MKTFQRFLLVIALIVAIVPAIATWHSGIVHAHSTFSDGQSSPEVLMSKAIEKQLDFLVVTDHYEQIDCEKKIGSVMADDFGFDNYLKRYCDNPTAFGTKNFNLTVLPNAEFMIDKSHVLAIGDLTKFFGKTPGGTLKECVGQIHATRALVVAAHPSYHNYPYDKRVTAYLNGIEFFNESDQEYRQTLDWYLRLIEEGKDIFVTAGCDTHTGTSGLEPLRWQRISHVWVDGQLDRKSLVSSLEKGQTYAAQYGARIDEINFVPGFKAHEIRSKDQHLTAKISFNGPITTAKQINLYRNGKLLEDRTLQMAVGKREVTIDISLNQYQKTSRYIIEVEGCLITSPIVVNVAKAVFESGEKPPQTGIVDKIEDAAKTAADKILPKINIFGINLPDILNPAPGKAKGEESRKEEPAAGPKYPIPNPAKLNFTGGVPILLGKNFQQVTGTLGRNPNTTEHVNDGFCWYFHDIPSKEYSIFLAYNSYEDPNVETKPPVVLWGSCYQVFHYPKSRIPPSQIVPKEILARKPDEICHGIGQNWGSLGIIWYIDNRTYFLNVKDSRHALYDTYEVLNENGELVTKYRLNQYGADFRNSDWALAFVYIDYVPDFFPEHRSVFENLELDETFIGINGGNGCKIKKFQ